MTRPDHAGDALPTASTLAARAGAGLPVVPGRGRAPVAARVGAGLPLALAALQLLGQTALAESEPRFEHTLPLVLSASNPAQQSFVRIINRSNRAGTVQIRAIDDSGRRFAPVSLALEARASVNLSAADLESGNADKGLSAGVGDGEGDWHLELETPLDVEPLAYVRHAGGFVATMHDVVAQDDSERYHVPTFNPASSRSKVSRLRLVNQAGADAEVLIEGLDDRGALPEYHVRLTLPAHGARTVSAQELESGASGLTGRLGDGEGKWRLFVSADRPIQAMSLLRSPSGHLTNLSTSTTARDAAPPRYAPADQPGFDTLVDGKQLFGNYLSRDVEFVSPGRFREREGVYAHPGRHTWERIGPNVGRVELYYDGDRDRDRCTLSLTFDSAATGHLLYTCNDADTGASSWRIEAIPAPGTAPDLAVASLSVSDDTPRAGEAFTLAATIRNRGDRRSAATTLRYYRSVNAAISASDAEIGTDRVESLPASATSDELFRVTTSPSGAYYFGACVDPVPGETDPGDNCAVPVFVVVGIQ